MGNTYAITAVILAGGQASRMGGNDKGLQMMHGQRLIDHVIEAIEQQADHLIISANRNLEHYRALGFPVFPDSIQDYAGPLAGMLAAFDACDSEMILTVPCDTPLLPRDLATRLLQCLEAQTTDLCCPHDGERLHPVISLIRRRVQPAMADYFNQGGRAVYRWFKTQKLAQADFSDCPKRFTNVNTHAQLRQLEQQLSRQNPGD